MAVSESAATGRAAAADPRRGDRRRRRGYDEARRVWNGMIDRRPALVVRCTGNADVIAADRVRARARAARLRARRRAQRRRNRGRATAASCIDLGAMRNVVRRPRPDDRPRRRRRAPRRRRPRDAGVRPRDAVRRRLADRHRRADAPRRHGLPHAPARPLVRQPDRAPTSSPPTGRLVHADAERHPDLLWALRGGGGNFGAVTSLEYRLHPVGPEVFMAITFYPAEAASRRAARVPRDHGERARRADGRRPLLDARRPRSRSRPSGTASRSSSSRAAGPARSRRPRRRSSRCARSRRRSPT